MACASAKIIANYDLNLVRGRFGKGNVWRLIVYRPPLGHTMHDIVFAGACVCVAGGIILKMP
eukprot:1157817-Pelagomonas_calceolata.AAC.12